MEEQRTGIGKDLEEIKRLLEESNKKKTKPFKLPFKAKVGNRGLKKGMAIVMAVNENHEIDFQRKPIVDSTIELNDTYHAVYDDDLLTYKGTPFLIQPKGKLTTWNPFNTRETKNETYGQKYVMARMKSDFIKAKAQLGWGVIIFGVVIAAIIGYAFLTGG